MKKYFFRSLPKPIIFYFKDISLSIIGKYWLYWIPGACCPFAVLVRSMLNSVSIATASIAVSLGIRMHDLLTRDIRVRLMQLFIAFWFVESLSCIASIEMDETSYAERKKDDQYSNSLEEYVDDEREVEEAADIDIVVEIDKFVVRSPEEIVRQVQRELCLIKLCWPQIPLAEDSFTRLLPDSYRCVSDKERLVLWYAENFRRQFHARYSDRRPLLLACDNECGIQVSEISWIKRKKKRIISMFNPCLHALPKRYSRHLYYSASVTFVFQIMGTHWNATNWKAFSYRKRAAEQQLRIVKGWYLY